MSIKGFVLSIAALTLVSGCHFGKKEEGSPQRILSDYVSRSFAVKDFGEKSRLVELTTGEVKEILDRLDEAAFKETFVDSRREFVHLKIKDERQLEPGKYSITYELAYVTKCDENVDKVTNKKHAVFVNEEGKWRISSVQNLKTFIEHQNEISF